ncbi:MAG: winged helix-turn-helix domain-containing protein [Rubrivivax sp.]|nr:winged helix-turn-helix domain-containing protein [Rubrivivax sp.]
MHVSQASAMHGVTGVVSTAGHAGNGMNGAGGQNGLNGRGTAEAILLPRRGTATAAGTAASGEPRLLLLAAGDLNAAEAWARGLVGEGLAVECRAIAASPLAGPTPAPDDGIAAGAPDAQAVALHVADALAPHLAQLRALRSRCPQLPLLAVVRGLRDLDHVLALEMGADDVLDVGVGAPVVAARLRALWRRVAAASASAAGADREPPRELRFGALHLKRLEREVRLAEQPVPLTEGEFEVLWLLASHAGQALSRRDILKRVRGLDDQPLDRSIDSRVYRIRAKLGDGHGGAARIRTVRHQGYAFSPTGW